ncbi:MAG: 30S ribosomal protein S6 [Kiritimatiellaceae bacterium]|nr:MAG: 30S ribosomal protein S6 [Kiritimatiellaceae bacterium]
MRAGWRRIRSKTLSKVYEGLFIFPEALDEAGLDQAIERVKEELEKLGGSLDSSVRMGKKQFALAMKKEKSGYYVVLVFSLAADQVDAFKARLKLSTNVFRHQFSALDPASLTETAAETAVETAAEA